MGKVKANKTTIEGTQSKAEIDKMNDLAFDQSRDNAATGLQTAREALEASKAINYEKGIADALSGIGACHLWLSEFDLAMENCVKAYSHYERLKLYAKQGKVKYTIGTIFFYLSDFDVALKSYNDAFKHYKKAKDSVGIADALNGIGSVYYSIGKNEKAIEYLNQCVDACKKEKSYNILQKALDGLGNAHANLKQYKRALAALSECLEVIDKHTKNNHVKSYALFGVGKIYLEQKKFDKAIESFKKSLEIRKKIKFQPGEASCLYFLGQTHLKANNHKDAVTYLTTAEKLAKKINSKEILSKIALSFSELLELKKDFKSSLSYYKLYSSLNEELKNERSDRRAKSIDLQVKLDQSAHEKKLLEDKNKKLQQYTQNALVLSTIGKELTSLLSAEKIIQAAYNKITELMDASSFGLAIYNEKEDSLRFPCFMENGEIFSDLNYSLKERDKLAVKCFTKNKEIIIADAEEEIQKNGGTVLAGNPTQSVVYLPFEISNGTRGVITVQSFKKNAYNNYHINMLRNLAVYAGIALENASLYNSLENKVKERTKEIESQKEQLQDAFNLTQLLSIVGQELTSSTEFDKIFLKLYENVNKLMDAGCFGVRLYKPEKNAIEYKFEIEKDKVDDETFNVSMDDNDNYSVICVKNKQVIFINDNLKEYKKFTSKIIVPSGEMPHSLIFCPMTIGERVVGLITVQSFQKNAYSEKHIEILQTLSSFTAIALENANLIANMEQEVALRTEQVVNQKEEIERSYKNTKLLSEIGKNILSEISIEKIISNVYKSINNLMDASIFGIAIYREDNNDLFFSGSIENGEKLRDFSYSLTKENIATACFKENKEIVINDWEKEYKKYVSKSYKAAEGEMPNSIIYIPLFTKDNKIGVITVQSFERNIYNDYHLNILRSLSLYIAGALENANLYNDLENRVIERTKEINKAYQDTKLLSKVSKDIVESLEIETIISRVYSNINSLMDATCFGIGLVDEQSEQINFTGFIENGQKMEDFFYKLDDERLATWCFKNNQEIIISNYFNEYTDYIKGIQKPVSGKDSTSIIYIPLNLKEKTVGVITVQSFEEAVYTDYHLDILRNLATTIATALENAKLYESLEDKVRVRTAEVLKQKAIIEEKNKDITDSIRYAKRIQKVILPATSSFRKNFNDYFILFKPRDIVSGDFYWIDEYHGRTIFAVADCTGHGVPGAMVSVICHNSLKQSVKEYGLIDPGKILDKTKEIIVQEFEKSDGEVRDGMDISLCVLDKENMSLEWAGANNPLWIIRNNQLIEKKPNKQPIGKHIHSEPFNTHTIKLFEGDYIYLFSDGYHDQFGGEGTGKKFKTSRLKALLLETIDNKLGQQKKILNKTFMDWKGNLEQVDDVCVIGVRV